MKSPLKDRPLRNPGETLERDIAKFKDEKIFDSALVIIMLLLLTALEWFRWYFDSPPSPKLMTLVAVIGTGLYTWKIIKAKRRLGFKYQGLEGEKWVGQLLEQVRESGGEVFHDVPGKGFNLDHVIVHTSGIYVIETKTYSKPDKGETIIDYDGKMLRFTGGKTRDAPLTQVRAARDWIQELIKESTGSKFFVQAVLVFPGWFIRNSPPRLRSDIWVLNPKALPSFIDNEKSRLSEEEVHMVAFHLSRYIRSWAD